MEARPKSSNVVLWVILAIVAIIVFGCIGLAVLFRGAISEFSQGIKDMTTTSGRAQAILPGLLEAMESYVMRQDEYPGSLDDLEGDLGDSELLAQAKEVFTYTKPPEDAPDSFVILRTETTEMSVFGEHSAMRIEVTKDLQAHQVQITPLNSSNRVRVQTN